MSHSNPNIDDQPEFYDRIIQPPWTYTSESDQKKHDYDIWKRTGGYYSYIPNLIGLKASVTELNYSIGVTSAIQAQIDTKANTADLGTMSSQDADNVAISGGTLANVTITSPNGSFTALQADSASITALDSSSVESETIKANIGTSTTIAFVPLTLSVQGVASGNVGSDETTLMSYTLPINSLDTNNTAIKVRLFGNYAANANAKTLKLYFGSAIILDTGAIVANDKSWEINATIIRTGASSQVSIASIISDEGTIGAYTSSASPSEAITSTIEIKLTGTATSDDDVVEKGLIIEWQKSS